MGVFVASLGIYPFLGLAFFPRTDAGQFTVNMKVPTGTRIEVTNDYVAKIEDDDPAGSSRPTDLQMILSNIGVVNDISSLYTTNAGMYTATIQVALNEGQQVGSFEYMDRVRDDDERQVPGCAHVLSERVDAGRDSQSGAARAHRRSGQHARSGHHLSAPRRIWRGGFATFPAWARSIFRRT